jgi:hypothetical protein
MRAKTLLIVFFSAFFLLQHAKAQIPACDSLVPVFYVDFTNATSDSTWTSPSVTRDGNCCGTIYPDRCVLFVITTGVSTVGVTVSMCGGPIPSGAVKYQFDCGPLLNVNIGTPGCGDTVFISTPGVHYLTYCKPGIYSNNFCVTSIAPPVVAGIDEQIVNTLFLSEDYFGENYFLNLNLLSPSNLMLNIFSADGKMISEKTYRLAEGKHSIPLSIRELAQGIYFCRVKGDAIDKSFKFIK